jgi:hypothetical protein
VDSQIYHKVIFYDIRKRPKITKTMQFLQYSATSETPCPGHTFTLILFRSNEIQDDGVEIGRYLIENKDQAD